MEKFKIEKTEEYENARKGDSDLSYYTLMRVRGSKPVQCFAVPSHLYKYSEHERGLYLKGHKNYWGKLGKYMNAKDNQYKEQLSREMEEQKWKIRGELKKSIASDISEIRYEILTGLTLANGENRKLRMPFENHGFKLSFQGARMAFPEDDGEEEPGEL